MSQSSSENYWKDDDPKGSNIEENQTHTSWSSSTDNESNQYSWCQFDEEAKNFQRKMEQVQKELINHVMQLSSSSTPAAFNIKPNIDFLIDEPVLVAVGEPLFDITNEKEDVNNMAFRLSCQSTAMLNKITELVKDTGLSFDNKFCLELRPASFYNKDIENQLWELRMNVDPVTWFDLQWRQCGDNEEFQRKCVAKAGSYIKKYRSFVVHQMPSISLHEPITAPPYCERQLTCTYRRYYDSSHPKHTDIICKVKTNWQRDDDDHECGQYLMDEYIVMEWSVAPIMQLLKDQTYNSLQLQAGENFYTDQSRFIFTANKEIIRDLVILPMPPWHLSNRQMIQLPLFWATAIISSKMLHREIKQKLLSEQQMWPVEAIAINFGQWEAAGSYDKRHIDTHAHAHLLLTLSFMNACDNTFFRALKGRVMHPPDYLRQNTQSLQFERLKNHDFDSKQMLELSIRLTNVENDIQGMKNDIQDIKTGMLELKEWLINLDFHVFTSPTPTSLPI
ncbi:unnamed protein product [Rotaria sp. Silwood1]|nr:unnamed protein product [Rotaria sp. Silwood1]CAF1645273.1 unnamed protein product [Rotaria sp. Silwood1]